MHQPALVRVLQTEAGLPHATAGLFHRQPPALLQKLAQGLPRHELHDDHLQRTEILGVVGAGDVGVVQLGHRLDLLLETQQRLGIVHEFRVDHFQGLAAVHALVVHFVDRAHASPAQQPHNAVLGLCLQFRRKGSVGDHFHGAGRRRRAAGHGPLGGARGVRRGDGDGIGGAVPLGGGRRPLGRAGRRTALREQRSQLFGGFFLQKRGATPTAGHVGLQTLTRIRPQLAQRQGRQLPGSRMGCLFCFHRNDSWKGFPGVSIIDGCPAGEEFQNSIAHRTPVKGINTPQYAPPFRVIP